MAQKYVDSFGTRKPLTVGNQSYDIFRLDLLEQAGFKNVSKLPVSLKVLLENLLRQEDNHHVNKGDIEALANWDPKAKQDKEIAFMPARVLMQDFTGVPAIVDLAAMREAMQALGRRSEEDQSTGAGGSGHRPFGAGGSVRHAGSFPQNSEIEFERNVERYAFCDGGRGLSTISVVVPPDTGHLPSGESRISWRLWYFAPSKTVRHVAYPDTVVGTDSHTTMINGLGVVGWGVGGIEAEAAMLGQPIYHADP